MLTDKTAQLMCKSVVRGKESGKINTVSFSWFYFHFVVLLVLHPFCSFAGVLSIYMFFKETLHTVHVDAVKC